MAELFQNVHTALVASTLAVFVASLLYSGHRGLVCLSDRRADWRRAQNARFTERKRRARNGGAL